jgi:hypothetical protein
MATRLQIVLEYLILTDQSGGIKGRPTYRNLRSTIDIINYTKRNNIRRILFY